MRLGDVIPDGGLRLGLIEQWLSAEIMPDTTKMFDAALTKIRADEELWFEEDGVRQLDLEESSVVDAILLHAVEATADLAVQQDMLDRVTKLQFDGGNDVYNDLLPEALSSRLECEEWELDTGGETEVFSVNSLDGIDKLANLESLDLDAHGFRKGGHDLTPLQGHAKLGELRLTGVAAGANVLTSLTALTKLDGADGLPEAVKAALVERGVAVT